MDNRPPSKKSLLLIVAMISFLATIILVVLFIIPRGSKTDVIEVQSSDGKLTLSVEPDALPEGMESSEIAITSSEAPEGTDGPEISTWYNLSPNGLTFTKPVNATFTSEVDPTVPGINVPAVFHLNENTSDIELIDGTLTTLDLETGAMTTTFPLDHFSQIVVANEGLLQIAAVVPEPTPVGEKVGINTIVTQNFGTAEFPPDWFNQGLGVTPNSSPELIEAEQEIQRESDWFRRMQSFTIPGQGNIAYATVDYTGTLQEIDGPILSPSGLIENRPFRRAISAAIKEKDRWKATKTFTDYTCEKEGTTQVAWRIKWQGFSYRSSIQGDVPTTLVNGEFQLNIPISCGDSPTPPPSACSEGDSNQIIKEAGVLRVCVTPPEPTYVGETVSLKADIEGRFGKPFGNPDQPEYFNTMEYYYPGHGMNFANIMAFQGQLYEKSGLKILRPDDIILSRPGTSELKVTADMSSPPKLPTVTSRDFTCDSVGTTTLLWEFPYEAYASREYTEDDVVQIQDTLTVEVPVECLEAAFSEPADPTEPYCGDGNIDYELYEECDNGNLDGYTCQDFWYDSGTLGCNNECVFDTSGCYDTQVHDCAYYNLLTYDDCMSFCPDTQLVQGVDQVNVCEEAWDTPGCYICHLNM